MWLFLVGSAHATWSIVATDAATSEVGGAGTSCVGSLDVGIIFAAAPGVGAVHAQALINTAGRDLAAQTLAQGGTPADAIAAITDPAFDGIANQRQYGVVDLSGNAAAWTGSANGSWAGDVQGTDGSFTFSAQGNILTGPDVVDRTAAAFQDPGLCDLADRLMTGLEAGAAAGEGDSRCTPALPSDSAFIQVIDGAGQTILDLSVVDTSPQDPLVQLRQRFDQWRQSNPCPTVDTADTGAPATDTGTSTPVPADTAPADTGPTTGTDGTDLQDDGTDEAPAVEEGKGGCGCASRSGPAAWVALLLAPTVRRRRSAPWAGR